MNETTYAFLLIIIIFMSFSTSFVFFYKLNLESKEFVPEKMNVTFLDPSEVVSYSGSDLQFFPNMRFNHNVITFTIDQNCDLEKKEKMGLAFSRIEKDTDNTIIFKKINDKDIADLTVTCNESTPQVREDYFIAGEGGATSIIKSDLFHIIEKGVVLLYYKQEKACLNYNIELHELLHVFGFKHSENRMSIMYPTTQCGQIFTQDITNELTRLYKIGALPDLYISDLNADKKGKYLNFRAEIKNQGLETAENSKLIITAEDEVIKTFNLGNISYGEGKIMTIEYLRLPLLTDTDLLKFTVNTTTQELSVNNNELLMRVASEE